MPKKSLYHSGGLAEIVDHPSAITTDYLLRWFSAPVIARGLELLSLPVSAGEGSLLALKNGHLCENLKVKNQLILGRTFFEYRLDSSHPEPTIHLSWPKLFHPSNWGGTTRHLLRQSTWLAKPEQTTRMAKAWIASLEKTKPSASRAHIEKFFERTAVPIVFAVNFLGSFYEATLKNELGQRWPAVSRQLAVKVKAVDWFTEARLALYEARQGKRTLESIKSQYGLIADSEFELTMPRWHEPAAKLAEKINNLPSHPPPIPTETPLPNTPLVTANYKFQCYRIEVKKALLPHLNALRQALLKNGILTTSQTNGKTRPHQKIKTVRRGIGISVSEGITKGAVVVYQHPQDPPIAGSIGIFPSTGPAYTSHFLQSKGLIFRKGSITSHGAIVAREFGLPAIVARGAVPTSGQSIELDATAGTWHQLPSQ